MFLYVSLAEGKFLGTSVPETGSDRLHPFSHPLDFRHLLLLPPIFSLLQCPVLPEELKDLHTHTPKGIQ